MGILLAFLPFFTYVIVQRISGIRLGLIAATIVAAVLLFRNWRKTNTLHVLEVGTLLLFGTLTADALLRQATWSIVSLRLRVDVGLLMIVLASIAARQPFTIQYARQTTAQELWSTSKFIRTNYVISSVWAIAFAVMVLADLLMLYRPDLPVSIGIGATVAVIVAAAYFTQWYPDRSKW